MDFSLTREQLELGEAVTRFARRELTDEVRPRDARGEFSRDLWQRCAGFGIQGLPIPADYGGSGFDALTTIVALEALGYGCQDNGLLFSLNAQMWSCEMPILTFGREEQKRRYLPGLCGGSLIGVQAMSEPASGSDAFSLRTSAEERGDAYVLNGSKTFITNAPVADLFVVFARTDPGRGFAGLSAFIVERAAPGLSVSREMHKMGLRTSPMGELAFQDCEVGADQMLGPRGAGLAIFNHSMDWERGCILASAVGAMRRQLERCVGYAKERSQFGQPIGKFQAVAHRLVDMKVRLETARLLLYQYGWLKASGKHTGVESAMTKLYVSESYLQSSLDALQIFGGYGYMTEYELEREVRDAVGGRLYSGTSDIQRNIIAGGLGL
ncbi:MAG TPA: acyl-CoA dehydrogenase family protein [bacterium]|nr:acyl-CoA dehydrogenase family protein [bacterium]